MKELTKIEEIMLLAIWRLEPEAYGVKIRKFVSRSVGRDFSYGNLYSALHQLTVKKYVCKQLGESTPDRRVRPKVYYSFTRAGLGALKAAREMQIKLWDGILPMLLIPISDGHTILK